MDSQGASKEPAAEQRRRELIEDARRQVEEAQGAWDPSTATTADSPIHGDAETSPLDQGSSAFSMPPSDSFAGYKLLREIHRGAQGVVYQAIQESMKRKVAIKVMKEGPFAGSADRARFDREVKLLGQLNHPNIVTIHGTGEAAGCHFFVMDYIRGQPLDVYMASEVRSVDDTLRLFGKICDAVASAHLRGIIHRDLKPSNIRVDAAGKPYVLDFGLAKSASDADASIAAMTGRFLGTPAWSSPEQAEGIPSNIDIRSDVYSLGVILFQMLTGRFPYDVTGSTQQVMDRIRKADPLRPRELCRKINDEVETIVLKCLSKERERRYQSAGEMARDVQRYLAGEVIEAKRDSLSYVFRKQLQKYKPQATIAAGFLIVTVLALVTVSILLSNTKAAQASEREQRKQAEDYAEEAELAKIKLKAANDALNSQRTLAFEFFDEAEEFIKEGWMAEKPEAEASLRHRLGKTYRKLGRWDSAELHLKAARNLRHDALGESHPDTLDSMNELASAYIRQGPRRHVEAEQLLNETLAERKLVLGPEHDHTLDTLNNLALLCRKQRRFTEAVQLYNQVLEIRLRVWGREDADTLSTMNNLASLYYAQQNYDDAAAMHEEVLEVRRELYEPGHKKILISMNNVAGNYTLLGRCEEAEVLLSAAVEGARQVWGDDHSNVGTFLYYQGRCYTCLGLHKKAEKSLVEAHKILKRKGGRGDPLTLETAACLVHLYDEWERPGDAEEIRASSLLSQATGTFECPFRKNDCSVCQINH